MKKPVIGIVCKHYKKDYPRPDTYIRDEVKQAIFDNGGVAIGILSPNSDKCNAKNAWKYPLTEKDKENFLVQLRLCDGIILQGGRYSDVYECYIAKYCYDHDIPCLGICAGLQNMVRAVGGTKATVKDVELHNSEKIYAHKITIKKESTLYQILGKETIEVNSRHFYHVLEPSVLTPIAFSSDNLIEAVEDTTKKCYLGVQFHPESLYKIDKGMNEIFAYFLNEVNQQKK